MRGRHVGGGRHAGSPRGERGRAGAPGGERGQASVELIGALPALLLLGLIGFQLLAIGYAKVLAGNAAEAGALAIAGGADAVRAAREAVPGWSEAGMQVRAAGGRVRVSMRAPSPLQALGRRIELSATASVVER